MGKARTYCKFLLGGAVVSLAAHAQGVLTIAPGRTAATVAGTGVLGYAGSATAAIAAPLATPSALAYDAAGNLYLADTNNHVIREVLKANGNLITVAGTGIAGFSGDGGPATSAQLDTPSGIALDSNGNLYIADAHNHRIRKVSNGIIATVAGTGTPGFAGDGGPATAAQLALPSAVTFDSNNRLLIADTNNQRIRAIANGTITTIAGNGEELFAGDNGPATAASLDQPTGLALDAAGNLYIADTHNQRIRLVNPTGTISTFAGNGLPSFSGSFTGDGGTATSASLARPVSVSVDADGNVFIADTGNQRIRQVTGGTIATVAGSGTQGFAGDGSPLTATDLNAPKSSITDSLGNLLIADTQNQRLRSGLQPVLSFPTTAVGAASTTQLVTLSNAGSADLSVTQRTISSAFTVARGTCSDLPITLAPGTSCTELIAFAPAAPGAAAGSLTLAGSGLLPQTVLLAGTALQGTSSTSLSVNTAAALLGQTVTFTAAVQPGTTGTVSFYDGVTQLGTAQPLSNSTASLTLSTLTAGTHSITAVFAGNASLAGSTSKAVAELIGDFDFSITPGGTGTSTASSTQTVVPGQAASFAFAIQPLAGPFNYPVTLSATGLPPGATVLFSPQTVTVGAAPAPFTMTVQTTATSAALHHTAHYGETTLAFTLLLLPFSGPLRRRGGRLGSLTLSLALLGTGLALTTITGCGSNNGFFGQAQQTYTVQVIGTARGANGTTLQHVASVQLTLQ